MMKKFFLFTIGLALSICALAQRTINDPNVELRTVPSFHGIEVSSGIDLFLSPGEQAVAVSAREDKMKARLKTEVKDGILKIWLESEDGNKWNWSNNSNLRAYVSFTKLDVLKASSGSDVKVDGAINSDDLVLQISGGSDFTGKVNAKNLSIDQSGGSDVNISGTVKNLTVEASGGSDLDGYDLNTEICNVSASGGSDVTITCNSELSATASGASDINWKGSATVKKASASGAGSVSHKS